MNQPKQHTEIDSNHWRSYIFDPGIPFEEKAWEVYRFQYSHCGVYRRFCDALNVEPESNADSNAGALVHEIPLLPVEAFKEAEIRSFSANQSHDLVFKSSGTGSMTRSIHYVYEQEIYRRSVLKGFGQFYDLNNIAILAYLPGYSENPDSSLVWMVNELIEHSDSEFSRFLPLEQPLDANLIKHIAHSDRQLLLFGAAFGLLDLLEMDKTPLPPDSLIIETGGMKTHQREISREELHQILSEGFQITKDQIHSEYGMAEMLSQAYQTEGEWFETVPWLRISIRDPKNPMAEVPNQQEGLIGILDLANIYSCSFILTGDKGIRRSDGKFKVLGRWDSQNLRGCNFLIDQE